MRSPRRATSAKSTTFDRNLSGAASVSPVAMRETTVWRRRMPLPYRQAASVKLWVRRRLAGNSRVAAGARVGHLAATAASFPAADPRSAGGVGISPLPSVAEHAVHQRVEFRPHLLREPGKSAVAGAVAPRAAARRVEQSAVVLPVNAVAGSGRAAVGVVGLRREAMTTGDRRQACGGPREYERLQEQRGRPAGAVRVEGRKADAATCG